MKNRIADGNEGFALVGLLVFTFFTGMLLSSFAKVISTSVKREKEYELHYILEEYRRGLNLYKKDNGVFPETIEEMSKKNYIRKFYKDPFTGKFDWELEKQSGKIKNVYSKSEERPIGIQRNKEGQVYKKYSQW